MGEGKESTWLGKGGVAAKESRIFDQGSSVRWQENNINNINDETSNIFMNISKRQRKNWEWEAFYSKYSEKRKEKSLPLFSTEKLSLLLLWHQWLFLNYLKSLQFWINHFLGTTAFSNFHFNILKEFNKQPKQSNSTKVILPLQMGVKKLDKIHITTLF